MSKLSSNGPATATDLGSSTRKLDSSFVIEAMDVPEKISTDLIFKHWREGWKSVVNSDSDFKVDARELTERFLTDATSNNLHYRAFVARKTSTQEIVGSIGCQVWDGPVPIKVVDSNAFSIGTIWGLYVERALQNDDEEVDMVSAALIKEAKAYLCRHRCKKSVVLVFDDCDQTCFVNAGFQQGNMLTLPLPDQHFEASTANEHFEIRKEGTESDSIVCSHWRKMWKEVGIPESSLVSQFDDVTHTFVQDARQRLGYQTIVARTTNGEVIGSVSCQVWDGPFPKIVKPALFQYGTIWAVYVNPDSRRQGVATTLMRSALSHLRGLGCDTAILVAASQAGQCVYERLGFAPNNALVCDLCEEQPAPHAFAKSVESPSLCEELGERLAAMGVTDLDSCILPALATATERQLLAVFDHDHTQRDLVVEAVSDIQSKHGIYVDPSNNWFTKNVTRFGRGFDMKKLASSASNLASKFDRLSSHYDHWTVGNLSKVETFVVSCFRTRLSDPESTRDLRLLDVACGIGLQGQTLRMCGYQGELVGTDISPGMIARVLARECYNHAYVANANDCLLNDSMPSAVAVEDLFDIVLCTGAMELLDQPRALASMANALKPGGELWVSFQYNDEGEESHVTGAFMADPTGHQNISGISKVKAQQQLANAGFDTIVASEVCRDAFYTPSPKQDGTLLPVPYLFVVAKKCP